MAKNQSFYLLLKDPVEDTITYITDNFSQNVYGPLGHDHMETFYKSYSCTAIEVTINFSVESDLMSEDPTVEAWGLNNFQLSLMTCHSSCLVCKDMTNYDCLSCYNNAYLTNDGQCVCNSNFFMIFVYPCIQFPCSSCVSTCPLPYYGDPISSSCINQCRDNYYKNNVDRICYLKCPLNYFGNQLTGYCDSSCPEGMYGDSISGLCLYCDTNCATCEVNSYTCLSCKYNWLTLSNNCFYLSNCKIINCLDNFMLFINIF